MKKYYFLFFLSFFSFKDLLANHVSGGEIIYEYLGPGTAAGTSKYKLTLKLFRDNLGGGAPMPGNVLIGIFNNSNNLEISGSPINVNITSSNSVPVATPPICMTNPPTIDYNVGIFVLTIDLPNNATGYTAAYQTCCRINPLANVQNASQPAQGEGVTYVCTIPGTNQLPVGHNSSPQFVTQLAAVCHGNNFNFDFSAVDPDGDSLVYYFCNAYNRGASVNSANVDPSRPPYQSVVYINGFSGLNPLGSAATINRQTGMISGTAPGTGRYVVCVCIDEYRAGVIIGHHRKDFILNVSDCDLARAQLNPVYYGCDTYTKDFQNEASSNNIQTYNWSFGDGSTSTLPNPSHTYADTGTYLMTLVVNRNLPCSDSTTALVKIYPGFFPAFSVGGQCKNTPIQFTDHTTSNYGTPGPWSWNFGDPGSASNSSTLQNPSHIYASTGNYPVELIVSSSKGCVKTLDTIINILDKPALTVTHDSLICIIDTLQLNAIGIGTFLWSPNYNINNIIISNPLVNPAIPTTYKVTLTDPYGCVGTDSVRVNVKAFVTLIAMPDSTICTGDAVVLRLNSDGLHYLWTETPAGNTLNDPRLKNPTARPLVTTVYHVDANIGKCISQSDIKITPIPYPAANAKPDRTICFGNSVQLQASGGSIYSWSPAVFLSALNIPNPRCVNPFASVRYIVSVRDTLGCPKPVRDTVLVMVIKIKADAGPRDTVVVIGQPLQLQATGGSSYLWTPIDWLDNPFISNPVALPKDNIEYIVKVSNSIGCTGFDSIRVKVYKLDADILVPSAFSPNGDGKNDLFRPIPIGMRSIDLFRVYNRWGQMLYSGTDAETGWDGKFAGTPQESATYVWYAEGVDYRGKRLKRKGYVVLIR